MKGSVLVLDDDPALTSVLASRLTTDGFSVSRSHSAEDALWQLDGQAFDLVVADVKMPGMNGLEFCERVTANFPDLPVFIITGVATLQMAIEAVRVGAYDFITKPIDMDHLLRELNSALRKRALGKVSHEVPTDSRAETPSPFDAVIGDSHAVQAARRICARVAPLPTGVLITGEPGVGKRMLARAIHDASPLTASGSFTAVRCEGRDGADLLTEFSEERLAALGLTRSEREGSDGGTLYLSEIESLPEAVQRRIIAVLDDTASTLSGASAKAAGRIICSSRLGREELIAMGPLSGQLLLRLASVTVKLPPLRERGGDLLLLARHYVREASDRLGKAVTGLTQAATERILMYTWPGNVRELITAMEHAAALARFEYVRVEDLPDEVKAYRNISLFQEGSVSNDFVPLEQLERRHILSVLTQLGGNKTLAARVLGLDRRTLYRKLDQYGYDGEGNG